MQYISPYAALEKHASGQPEADAIIIDDRRLSHSEIFAARDPLCRLADDKRGDPG